MDCCCSWYIYMHGFITILFLINVKLKTIISINTLHMYKLLEHFNCCPAYFRAINLPWVKNKKLFLKNDQKTYDSTMIFGYIFRNRIQPFEAANISAVFFLCRPIRKNNGCHTFWNKFQDDISCAFAMYS